MPDWASEPDTHAWLATLPDPPVLYATLGSILGVLRGPLEAVVDGLATGGWLAVVVTGRYRKPETLGPLPDDVRVEPRVPQRAVLDTADLVLHHASYSTCMDAARAGTPRPCCPCRATSPSTPRPCAARTSGASCR